MSSSQQYANEYVKSIFNKSIIKNIQGPLRECRSIRPGASGFPYYCTSICVHFGCTRLDSCVDSKPKKILLYLVGCNNWGGGGNFSKVKRFVAKWVGTRKRLFSRFLRQWCDFRNSGTCPQSIFYSWTNICIFAPVHELLEYARTLGFVPYFATATAQSWGVFRHFCVLYKSTQTCHLFYCT